LIKNQIFLYIEIDTNSIKCDIPLKNSEFVGVEPRTPTRQRSVLGTPSLEESFIITKSSLKESEIYRKCSLYFPAFFPRIYEINQTQGGAIEYIFTRMLPLFEHGQCSWMELFQWTIGFHQLNLQ
jgi:hypothetical protein